MSRSNDLAAIQDAAADLIRKSFQPSIPATTAVECIAAWLNERYSPLVASYPELVENFMGVLGSVITHKDSYVLSSHGLGSRAPLSACTPRYWRSGQAISSWLRLTPSGTGAVVNADNFPDPLPSGLEPLKVACDEARAYEAKHAPARAALKTLISSVSSVATLVAAYPPAAHLCTLGHVSLPAPSKRIRLKADAPPVSQLLPDLAPLTVLIVAHKLTGEKYV